jgi:hypothetical protein
VIASLRAALQYAARGWPVFPLNGIVKGRCSCGRSDCSSPGKHPLVRKGLHEATTDLDVIHEWWRRWSNANVAIATGDRSGIVVVDIDLPRALPSLDKLIHKLPRTLTALTGGGGIHLVYEISSSVGPRSSAATSLEGTPKTPKTSNPVGARGSIYSAENAGLRSHVASVPGISDELPGVDTRANGGYVVAPPGLHVSGQRYTWLDVSVPIAPVPEWMQESPRRERPIEVHPPRFGDGTAGTDRGLRLLNKQLAILRAAREGTRNHSLNRCAFIVACAIARGDLDGAASRYQLEQTALAKGLSSWETKGTLQSAFRATRGR